MNILYQQSQFQKKNSFHEPVVFQCQCGNFNKRPTRLQTATVGDFGMVMWGPTHRCCICGLPFCKRWMKSCQRRHKWSSLIRVMSLARSNVSLLGGSIRVVGISGMCVLMDGFLLAGNWWDNMFMNRNEEEATRMNLQMGILLVCQVFESRSENKRLHSWGLGDSGTSMQLYSLLPGSDHHWTSMNSWWFLVMISWAVVASHRSHGPYEAWTWKWLFCSINPFA